MVVGGSVVGILIGINLVLEDSLADPADPAGPPAQAAPEKVWSIGIYTGSSPFDLAPAPGITNPVIAPRDVTDMNASVVAHPFMIRVDGMYYMFFTAKNKADDYGDIGLAESRDGLHWTYRQTVLDAPYHLAYPYVFQWGGEVYMIPEGYQHDGVRLYRATDFPTQWEYVKDLIAGDRFVSPSVVRYRDRWWMFVSPPGNETLLLYYADDLLGAWTEHPASPIVEQDANIARPGGRPLVIDGTLYRITQDCYPTYGNQVHAFRITEISPTSYREQLVEPPLATAGTHGWNAAGMHHLDAHRVRDGSWIVSVDGIGTLPGKE